MLRVENRRVFLRCLPRTFRAVEPARTKSGTDSLCFFPRSLKFRSNLRQIEPSLDLSYFENGVLHLFSFARLYALNPESRVLSKPRSSRITLHPFFGFRFSLLFFRTVGRTDSREPGQSADASLTFPLFDPHRAERQS